jgi:hypothetical protein
MRKLKLLFLDFITPQLLYTQNYDINYNYKLLMLTKDMIMRKTIKGKVPSTRV